MAEIKKVPLQIPILMYHSICEPASTSIHPYYLTETAPDVFRKHMSYLRERGYCTLTPDELLKRLRSPAINPSKTVLITFDDGYRDVYTHAFPILQEYGFSATVYLPTNFIGSATRTFVGKECLSWEEVRHLSRAGIVFGSHTVTHSKLYSMSTSILRSELQDSKATIEQEVGATISSFAYPYAFPEVDTAFVSHLCSLLKECGYSTGMTTIIGSRHRYEDSLVLKRLPVNSLDDQELFSAKLEGSYDWLYWFQYLSKRINLSRKQSN